jgi:hypothetical protein
VVDLTDRAMVSQFYPVLSTRLGDMAQITNLPSFLPPDDVKAIVWGQSEVLGDFVCNTTWQTQPESPYEVLIAGTGAVSDCRADTGGSTLNDALTDALDTNPYFANGSLTGWSGFNGTVAASQAIPGGPYDWSCLFTVTTALNAPSIEATNTVEFPVTVGNTYQASAWVYHPTGGSVCVGFDWRTSGGSYLSTSTTNVTVPAGVWTPVSSGDKTAPATAAYACSRVGLSGTPAIGTQLYVQGIISWGGTVAVATDSGSAIWTTNSADWPFDILVGGERMTVTAISGASSPQTFTVTRSVNGIMKTHSAGESVTLFAPSFAALV